MRPPDGSACIAEVNSPCCFAQTQESTGVDIAGRIVEALLAARSGA